MIPMTHEIQTTSSMMFGKVPVEIHLLSGIKKRQNLVPISACAEKGGPGLSAGAEGFLADFRLLRTLIP